MNNNKNIDLAIKAKVESIFQNAGVDFKSDASLKLLANLVYSELVDTQAKSCIPIDPKDPATDKAMNDGFKCKCCGRNVAWHYPSITKRMAHSLLNLYQLTHNGNGKQYYHMSDDIGVSVKQGGAWAKLRWWGLIEEMEKNVDDVIKLRSGYWKITRLGKEFVEGKISLSKSVKLYNSTLYGFKGKNVYFDQCLEEGFDIRSVIPWYGK